MVSDGKSKSFGVYELLYAAVLILLLVAGLMLSRSHKVGIIDMQKVAHEIGLDTAVNEQVQALQKQMSDRIKLLQDKNQEQRRILADRLKLAEGDARQAVEADVRRLDLEFRGAVNDVAADGQRQQQHIVATYQSRLDPYVRKVARRKRMDLVMAQSAQFLYVRSLVDVTDEMVQAFKADEGASAAVLAPVPALTNAGAVATDEVK